MKKTLIGLLALVMVGGLVSFAQALDVTVRVTITSAVGIELVDGGLIDFGSMAPGAVASIDDTPTVIRNSGSGVNQTYKMSANSPGVWTAGSSAIHDTYVLKAAFHGSEPAPASFGSEDTLVEDTEITASGTVLSIDGSVTGLSVPYNAERSIWYEFQPPATSTLTDEQNITVTITAVEG